MQLPRLLTLLAFFMISRAVARANLGDTEAKCIAGYGAESDVQDDLGYRQVGDRAATFNAKVSGIAMSIRIVFLHGFSCHESYSNADSSTGLTQDQMKSILNLQSNGLKWEKGKTIFRSSGTEGYTFGTIDWLRSDGASARFFLSSQSSSQKQTGQIDLSTKQYADAQNFYDKENGGN